MRIQLETDLNVVGEAADVADGLKIIQQQVPDLAVIDISLKSGNGIELIKQTKERFPEIKMLVWSMYDESLYAERALRAGAMGYINKEHVTDTIVVAIRTVLGGEVYISPNMSAKVLRRLVAGKGKLDKSQLKHYQIESWKLFDSSAMGEIPITSPQK